MSLFGLCDVATCAAYQGVYTIIAVLFFRIMQEQTGQGKQGRGVGHVWARGSENTDDSFGDMDPGMGEVIVML